MTYTAFDKLEAIERELVIRKRVYSRWVGAEMMTAEKAAHELATFEAIADDYAALAAKQTADHEQEIERLRTALRACIGLIEDSQEQEIDGYERGVSDVELVPDGSYKLSDARAALSGQEKT